MKTSPMMSLILLGALLSAGAATAPAAEPEVLAELARNKIYEGESVQYTVTLNHVRNPSTPDLSGFKDFKVALLGNNPQNFSSTSIINGRVTKVERYGMQYVYRLTPTRAGRLTVPAPVASVGGKVLKGPELSLAVVAPEQQDVVLMEMTSEPESVYPMQPFNVTLSVLVRDLPAPYADNDPLAAQRAIRAEQPALQIPWAADDSIPKGLEPRRSGERWCQTLQSPNGVGFSMNNLAVRDAMSMMLDDDFFRSPFGRGSLFDDDFFGGRSPLRRGPRMLIFEPRPTRVVRKDARGNEVGYWQYDFTRKFTPKMIGRYTFAPASLKGKFLTGVSSAGQGTIEDVYAIAPALAVTVKDVPLQGRPDSYMGAVGAFQIDAALTPQKAKVGDPMTLTLKMTGEGTLDNASPPDLLKVPGIADDFKVYDATEEGIGPTREFTYSLRPLKEGIEEFPAVSVSYFDVDREEYVTLRTGAIPIEVGKADKLSSHQIVAARRVGSPGSNIEVKKEGIFANVTDLSAVRDETVRPVHWLIGLGGLAVAYLALAGIVALARHRSSNVARQRRQSGASRAKTRLHNARAELKANRLREGADHVRAALIGLVADMTDSPEAGMTPRDVERRLEASGVADELKQRVHGILQACDGARYGAADNGVVHAAKEAEGLLKPLARQLKLRKRF